MLELVALILKTYSYFINDGSSDKKANGTKKICNEKYLKLIIIKIAD